MRARYTRHVALLGSLTVAATLTFAPGSRLVGDAWAAGKKMNLQVLPATMSEKEVKAIMKGWAQSLGVKCDFCHEVSDFSKDTEKKQTARLMARMVNDVNTNHLAKYKVQVSCNTCHRGHEHPPEPPGAKPHDDANDHHE